VNSLKGEYGAALHDLDGVQTAGFGVMQKSVTRVSDRCALREAIPYFGILVNRNTGCSYGTNRGSFSTASLEVLLLFFTDRYSGFAHQSVSYSLWKFMKTFSRSVGFVISSGSLTLLAACGGGDSVVPVQAQATSVGGVWKANYTAANGNVIEGKVLVAEDGRFFGASRNLTNNCVGLSYGTLTSAGSTFTGTASGAIAQVSVGGSIPACTYADGATASTSSVSGSVVERNSITITSTATTSKGLALGTQTVTGQFDPQYNVSSSLGAISGVWKGPTGTAFTISTSGQLAITDADTACALSGQVSIINPAYNAYSAAGTISNCNASNSALNGAAVRSLLYIDNSATPNKLVVGQEITLTNGTKLVAVSTNTR
jgi:hypothetical protein